MSKQDHSEDLDNLKNIRRSVSYSVAASTAVIFISGGAVFYHLVEKFNWLDSFYFTFMTLATVGYGDFVPKTNAGKLFTMVYVLFGITIFVLLARLIVAGTVLSAKRRRDTYRNKR